MKHYLFIGSLWWVLCSRSVAAELPATNSVIISPQLIEVLAEEARANHPALRAANARADAAVWNASAVRTWEDPTARIGVMGAEREKRADDGDLIYGVEQKLPTFGKARAVRAVAQAEAVTQRREAAFRELQLKRDLTVQLLKEAIAQRLVNLGGEDVSSLEILTANAEDKYRNGVGTQVEVLQAQNERARRVSRLRSDESLLRAEHASLMRLLGRTNDSPLLSLVLPGAISQLPPIEALVEHATQMAPQLDVMRASIRQAESSATLARKQRYPNLSVGLEGRQFVDTGEFREALVTFGLSIPWGNRARYAADVKRESRKVEAARLDLADMQLAMRDEVTRHVILIDNARREAELYRGEIIPRSEQAASVARENWLNNRGTLRDVFEMRRALIDARITEARSLAEHHSWLAELSLHCGIDVLTESTGDSSMPMKGTP